MDSKYAVILLWTEGPSRGMTQVASWWNTADEAITDAAKQNAGEGNPNARYLAVSSDRFGYFRSLTGESLYA